MKTNYAIDIVDDSEGFYGRVYKLPKQCEIHTTEVMKTAEEARDLAVTWCAARKDFKGFTTPVLYPYNKRNAAIVS